MYCQYVVMCYVASVTLIILAVGLRDAFLNRIMCGNEYKPTKCKLNDG